MCAWIKQVASSNPCGFRYISYHMFIELMITWVSLGFSRYIRRDTNIAFEKQKIKYKIKTYIL